MKLTFLGTGTSTGVPMVGCGCEVCRSTNPRDHRLRSSVYIQSPEGALLIDPGPDFRYQALRAGIKRIDAVLVTHSHYDHVGGLDDLRPFCHACGGHLPLYCTQDVADDIINRVPYCFAKHPYPGVPTFSIHIIDRAPFTAAGMNIVPLPIIHHKEIRGFRIGPLAYVTDCKIMPPSTMQLLKGVKVLVINALRIHPHPTHMSLSETLAVISDVKPSRAFLTHMADAMGLHDSVNQSLPQGVELAYDELTITV